MIMVWSWCSIIPLEEKKGILVCVFIYSGYSVCIYVYII